MKGQSLFEVIMAVGISAMILTAIVSLSTLSVANSERSSNSKLSVFYTQEALSFIRLTRDSDWATFAAYASTSSGSDYCMKTPTFSVPGVSGCQFISGTNLVRTANLTKNALATYVNVTVNITWQDGSGTHQEKTVTRLSNWNVSQFLP